MVTQPFKTYDSFADFTNDFIITVMDEGYATIVVNYQDYSGLIASLQEKTINGNALHLDPDTYEGFDNDVETAKVHDGHIMVTVFDDAVITGEAVVYEHPEAYAEGTYFIEKDAESFLIKPIVGRFVPFEIAKAKI